MLCVIAWCLWTFQSGLLILLITCLTLSEVSWELKVLRNDHWVLFGRTVRDKNVWRLVRVVSQPSWLQLHVPLKTGLKLSHFLCTLVQQIEDGHLHVRVADSKYRESYNGSENLDFL